MFRESHLEIVRTTGTKLGAMLVGLLFVVGAAQMVANAEASIKFFESLNIPAPVLWFWPLMIIKAAAGLALIVGKRTTEASSVLIMYTLIATLLVHMSPQTDPTFPTGMLKNLAIVGGLLFIMGYGPHGIYVKGETE